MDGVIVDNRDAHMEAFVVFAERHHADFSKKELLSCFGSTNEVILSKIFKEGLTPQQVEELSEEKEVIYREIYQPQPVAGLVDLLHSLKEAGIKTAVGSSAPRENVDFILEKCDIGRYFDAIACGSEITHSKPDPEVYLLAAQKLGVKPTDCIVCEDAFVGVEAARRAGAKVVALATTFPRESHHDYDLLADDFTQVDVDKLRGLMR